jgi:hypothetical protein
VSLSPARRTATLAPVPLAIEIFELQGEPATLRIDINGAAWRHIAAHDLAEKLAEIGRAYVQRRLADILREPPSPQ